MRYDPDSDTLTVILGPKMRDTVEYEAGDITVTLDGTDALVEIRIATASRFIARALWHDHRPPRATAPAGSWCQSERLHFVQPCFGCV